MAQIAGLLILAGIAAATGFSLPEETEIEQSNLVTVLPSIGPEYSLVFSLLVTRQSEDSWRSVLHLTQGGNYGCYGDRVPGVWLGRGNTLTIAAAVNTQHNYYHDIDTPLIEGQWYRLHIAQVLRGSKYIYQIQLDGETVLSVENRNATSFTNVSVYVSDPWYPHTQGKIKDFSVTDGTPVVKESKGCKCGMGSHNNRIVGGSETSVNSYPWMAALATLEEIFYCGGTLVSAEWVLTAAHCVLQGRAKPTPAQEVVIVLGEQDRNTTQSRIPRNVVSVAEIFRHPEFNTKTYANDIALVKLGEAVNLRVYRPACMDTPGQDLAGVTALVYGWGTTAENGRTSDKLLQVKVPIVSQSVCQAGLSDLGWKISSGMLCAGGARGQDACQGDSGGPLTVSRGGQHTLVGSVSFGYGCGRAGRYGVYARTAAYRAWLDSTMLQHGGATLCSP